MNPQNRPLRGRSVALVLGAVVLIAVVGVLASMCLLPVESAWAQIELLGVDPVDGQGVVAIGDDVDLLKGWRKFADGMFLIDTAVVLLCSIILAAVIAYHPTTRRKASSITELEQPKTFIMYSMIGAIFAQIVVVGGQQFALVIFGIGGLLRFRTDVGEAKDTGRVILVTIVGLCCGIKLFVVAVFATAIGYIIIHRVESQLAGKLVVKGLTVEALPKAQKAYAELLSQAGCRIIGGKKNVVKGQFSVVFSVAAGFEPEEVQKQFAQLPAESQGAAADWDIS